MKSVVTERGHSGHLVRTIGIGFLTDYAVLGWGLGVCGGRRGGGTRRGNSCQLNSMNADCAVTWFCGGGWRGEKGVRWNWRWRFFFLFLILNYVVILIVPFPVEKTVKLHAREISYDRFGSIESRHMDNDMVLPFICRRSVLCSFINCH